jgi:predicted secreted Zn-dependent protease
VTGDTAEEIRESINATRGRDYDAYTTWYLSWQFADCVGGGLVVTADIVYSMPDWDPPAGVAASLVGSWDAYMSALFCHEHGHARIGLEAANAAYDALAALDAGGDCGAQQNQASAAFTLVLDEYRARELQYDESTNHGATMGAVFP